MPAPKKEAGRRATPLSRQQASVSPASSLSSSTVTTPVSSWRARQMASAANAGTTKPVLGKPIPVSDDESSTRSPSQAPEARGPRSFAHPAFTDIGNKLKECNDTLGDIQMLGVSHVAVLPELVLVGDQSSGKSSLMSALARLNLPTSNGICTRCPFHIRMSSSKDSHWSCTVSLQQEYDYHPPANRAIKQTDVTKRKPFPPWEPKLAIETVVFKTIYENDPIGIDTILRWAQVAALNPSQNPEQFVPGEGSYARETNLEDAKQLTEARFSPNVVFLEMKGPDFPDLSFYDLPGLFQIAEDRVDDYLVDVVENLTRKYVNREEAIILLALPMDHDLDNSKTLRVIRELNAESRTFGVLTKADRRDFNMPDTITYWRAVLDEKKQRVKQAGFYITSLPPDQPLDNLVAWEETFFNANVSSWPREFDDYAGRCGVNRLRCHITKALGDAFARGLPNIKEKFRRRLEQIQADLDKLPEIPQNVEHEVRMSLQNFYTSVKRAVDNQDFDQNCKELTESFFECLVQLKPKCIMVTERPKPKLQAEEVVIVSDDSGNETLGSKRPPPKGSPIGSTPRRRRPDRFTTPVKTEEYSADASLYSPVNPTPSLPQNLNTTDFRVLLRMEKDKEVKLSLQEIQKEIKLKTRGGFGDVVPFEVHEALCLKAVSQWEKPLRIYIDKSITMLMGAVTQALESSLKDFSQRLIYKESEEFLIAFLKEQGAHQTERLIELHRNETYKAVTINEGGLNHFKTKEKELLESHRLFTRAKAAGAIERDRPFKRDEQMSREEKLEQSKLLDKYQAQCPEDEFKREVDVAATVRAYYMTAATRFVDGVSMDINSRLFRSFRDGALDYFLDGKLGLFPYPDSKAYTRLMEEDTATAERRQQLRKEREKLIIAMERILELERSLTASRPQKPTTYGDGSSEHSRKVEICRVKM
ncbi:P-loop containing nucleoside triphosphate hydrolase protein [Xylaria telfairii]|nr:P-loop containing nucleoside triphosphate hydrolase protein [Xylaria telfairii]